MTTKLLNPISELKFNPQIAKKVMKSSNNDWDVITLGSGIHNESISLDNEGLHTPIALDEICADEVKRTRTLESRNQPVKSALTSNFSRIISEGTVSSETTLFLLENKDATLVEKKGLTEKIKNSLNPEHEMRLSKKMSKTHEQTMSSLPKLVK